MPPMDTDHGSLDSSWASLVPDDYSEDDLQSEHTDVGSLLDVHSSDDVHSIADGVNTDDAESTDEEDLGDTLTKEPDRGGILEPHTQNELPPHSPSSATPQPVDTKEARSRPVGIYTTSRQLTEPEAQSLPALQYPTVDSMKYSSVIQMPVLDEGVDLNTSNYFKVLLLGRHVEQFRTEIQRKLGDVLVLRAATSSQSRPSSVARFHLVPNTFGPGAEPDYADLVAIDTQIDFDCYDLVTPSEGMASNPRLVLRNSQTGTEITSRRNGSRFVVANPRWTVPDLAIVCLHLGKGDIMDRDSYNMLSFVERHGIPHVTIRMDRGWHGRYDGAIYGDSLYESIVAQHNGSQWTASPILPIDMAAFLNLDAVQLNSHLAYLGSTPEESSSVDTEDSPVIAEEKLSNMIGNLPRLNTALPKNLFMVLWVVGVYTFLGYHLWPMWSDPILGANSGDVIANVGAEHPLQITTTQMLPQASCITPPVTGKSNQIVPQVVDVTSSVLPSAVSDDTQHFQVGVAGDNQLLVKLPKVALDHKKRTHLGVEVRRDNRTIPVAVQQLFEGVFSVQLLPHDAYGDIEVELTMTKPRLSETLTVSLGDRHVSKARYMRELWSMLHENIQGKVASVSTRHENLMEHLPFGGCWTLVSREGGRLGLRKSLEQYHRYSIAVSKLLKDALYDTIKKDVQTAQDRVVQYKEKCVEETKILAGALLSKVSEARSRLNGLVKSTNQVAILPEIHTAAVVDKLETARGRAHRIVSGVAGNLRAPN